MSTIRKRPLYVKMNGLYYPEMFSPQCFKEALEYKAQPGDVFICTYPKCGTTWMQNVALYIFRKGKQLDDPSEFLKCAPFIDMIGNEGIDNMPRPGAFKTHLPFTHMPYSPEAKYVFVARNPKDCCTSFYHHAANQPGFGFLDGEFDAFFEVFMAGEVEYGDYFDHFLSWYPHRNDPNVFYTTYENMKKDIKGVVIDIAKFLGQEYIEAIEKDNAVLDNILMYSSFDYMKKHLSKLYDMENMVREKGNYIDAYSGIRHKLEFSKSLNPPGNLRKVQHMRKGVVGDWKNHLSPEQNERLNRRFLEKFKGTEVLQWYPVENLN